MVYTTTKVPNKAASGSQSIGGVWFVVHPTLNKTCIKVLFTQRGTTFDYDFHLLIVTRPKKEATAALLWITGHPIRQLTGTRASSIINSVVCPADACLLYDGDNQNAQRRNI